MCGGGILSYLQDILGGFCPRQQKRVLSGGDFVRIPRGMLSKMRISAYKLAIENGRYTRIKKPKRERLCTACNSGELEDEKHFLLNCNAYRSIRHVFWTKLVNMKYQCPDLKIILDNNNYYILRESAKFIENCFKQRETVIAYFKIFLKIVIWLEYLK